MLVSFCNKQPRHLQQFLYTEKTSRKAQAPLMITPVHEEALEAFIFSYPRVRTSRIVTTTTDLGSFVSRTHTFFFTPAQHQARCKSNLRLNLPHVYIIMYLYVKLVSHATFIWKKWFRGHLNSAEH